jgi:hypothetical protein
VGVSEKTNREVWKEVTRGDLRLLNDELKLQLIKDELAGNWAAAAKEQHYPLRSPGAADVVEPSAVAAVKQGYYPVRGLGDAEVVGLRPLVYALEEAPGGAEVGGPRPLFGIKEEYSSIQWPESDARVGLRDAIHVDHMQRSTLHFDEEAGMLTLTQSEQGDDEQNKWALTRFIGRHFGWNQGIQRSRTSPTMSCPTFLGAKRPGCKKRRGALRLMPHAASGSGPRTSMWTPFGERSRWRWKRGT